MDKERDHVKKVVYYYNVTEPFYKHFWHGSALGLHYGFWDEGVSNRKEAIIKENEVLSNLAKMKAGDLVLDAGSGVGGSSIWLAKERNANVVGLNIVNKQLTIGRDLAKRRGLLEDIDFVEGDYHELPFKERSFDVFWSLESLEHATNIERFIQEAYRVLKPDGRIIIAATFKGREELTEEEQKQLNVGMNVSGAFNDFQTANQVSSIMRNIGFMEVTSYNKTNLVMRSSRQMTNMCKWGLPVAKATTNLHLTSPVLVQNNQWGLYQEGLFNSGATSYNVLLGKK